MNLTIYDLLGRSVKHLLNEVSCQVGTHKLKWDGTNQQGIHVPTGVYVYRIRIQSQNTTTLFTAKRKLALIR